MDGLQVVLGAGPAGDRETLVGLCILDLEGAVNLLKEPSARQIAIAVELHRGEIVRRARAASYRQALAGLLIRDLNHAARAQVLNEPLARRIAISVELHRSEIVRRARAASYRQALASFHVHQHLL